MLNRKGHLPTMMLFFAALTLVTVAWFTFLTFNGNIEGKTSENEKLVSGFINDEAYVRSAFKVLTYQSIAKANKEDFRRDFEENFINKSAELDEVSNVSGNFFGRIRVREPDKYFLIENDGTYMLDLKDIFVISESDSGEIRSDFNLSIIFSEAGILSEDL